MKMIMTCPNWHVRSIAKPVWAGLFQRWEMPKSDQGVHTKRYQIIPRVLIFIFDGDRVLLIKGAPNKRLWANQYNGIGGHIERGEDA
jgi:predicted NUDIX family phosphoesterase